MFKNYLKTALRNLRRNKVFSAINIAGLTLGIAACLLIVLFVKHQLSFDRYNTDAHRIVRVVLKGRMQVGEVNEANIMPPVAATLKKDFPEIEEATRIVDWGYPRISYDTKLFKEDRFAFVDSNIFRMFTIPLLKGNPHTALNSPNTVVISSTVAKRYFGNSDPMGKTLQFLDSKAACQVTGVFDEIPSNSHFHFGILASMSSWPDARSSSWMTSGYHTYLRLPKGYDRKKLEAQLPEMVDRYMGPQLRQAMGLTMDQFRKNGNSIGLFLQPLTDIHLHSHMTGEMEPAGNISYVYIFSVVAVFMLIIACINFTNLSTASASKRAKEVGVRKVMGSLKGQLIRQFLAESLLLTAGALILAIIVVQLALPFFNDLTGQQLRLNFFKDPWMLLSLLSFGLLTGILAGSYPAFYISSFKPVKVLKGQLGRGAGSAGLRSGLVIFQFCISISMMVGTMVVYKQLSFIRNKELGYNKSQVLVVEGIWWLGQNRDAFRQRLLQDPRVKTVTASSYLPAGYTNGNNFFAWSDNNTSQMIKNINYIVDESYIPTLGMSMSEGRNFSKEFGSDSAAVILNQAAVRAFGWQGSPLGHTITHAENDGKRHTYHVVGVVKDFHFRSLHEQITPLVMTLGDSWDNFIVRIDTRDIAGLLATIGKTWTQMTSESGFTWSFLDQRFNDMYKGEQNVGIILAIFAGLTIFVACLGLFGLATFTALQRTKEMGVRKVLGADVKGLVLLLSKDFLRLVGWAFLIATPIAWYGMNQWLKDFAYRVDISWTIFAAAAGLALLVAISTIGWQAIRAATVNPVKSLRTE